MPGVDEQVQKDLIDVTQVTSYQGNVSEGGFYVCDVLVLVLGNRQCGLQRSINIGRLLVWLFPILFLEI